MIARRFLMVAATGALALVLAGCGGSQAASTSSAGQNASASVAASASASAATSAPASTSAATESSAPADASASAAASPSASAASSSASAPASPAAPAAEGITEQDAIAIALAHAGFAEGDVTFTKVGQDLDDGRNEWEIEFIVDTTEYDYDIDAATGDIIAFDNEIEDDLVVQSQAPTADIGRDAAVAVALQDAGVAEADCIELEAEIDYDSSPQHYDVSFTAGGMEYDYDIDVATGDILTRSQEVDD